MRGVIKSVLAEGLKNSVRLERQYQAALAKLPVGCLSVKVIKGHKYHYLVCRKKGKLCYEYKGHLSAQEVQRYAEAKKYRAKYRKLLSQSRKQIKFLRGSLRGKEAI